jgi:hypothetical protein
MTIIASTAGISAELRSMSFRRAINLLVQLIPLDMVILILRSPKLEESIIPTFLHVSGLAFYSIYGLRS